VARDDGQAPGGRQGREVGQNSLSDSCKKIGYTGADVDRFLGINTSAVNRLAVSDDVSKVEK